jgi:class 3 adenylate cyclase
LAEYVTPQEILKYARSVREGLDQLRRRVNCVVIFVDLVGSTEYKDRHPSEDVWLPRLAAFLAGVSRIIAFKGRVVKYVGDEVMGVFEGDSSVLDAEHAIEEILAFCLGSGDLELRAKVGLDAGAVSMLDFRDFGTSATRILGDPQGVVVDRCARIVGRALPNTALASEGFWKLSKSRPRWRFAGRMQAKGIQRPVRVYQLRFAESDTPRVAVTAEMTVEECKRELASARELIERLKALHP